MAPSYIKKDAKGGIADVLRVSEVQILKDEILIPGVSVKPGSKFDTMMGGFSAATPTTILAKQSKTAIGKQPSNVGKAGDKSLTERRGISFVYVEETDKPNDKWVPRRIAYGRHPIAGRDDSFYESEVMKLFQQVETFVEDCFCSAKPDNMNFKGEDSLWLKVPWPQAFIKYAEMVAEPDVNSGGWNRLICDRNQRKLFMIGIMTRIIEAKIFSELLFGANEHQMKMLETMEKTLVFNDGYERTALREQTVRTLIGDYALTIDFDSTVLRTTVQICQLLWPFITFVRGLPSAQAGDGVYTDEDSIRQAIHDIVSQAGYLSLCFRHESTIFVLRSEKPGSQFDLEDQCSIDTKSFHSSKENVTRLLTQGGDDPSEQYYHNLTKIVVWPSLKRYKPGNGLKDGEKKGFRVYTICKGALVPYWGSIHPDARKDLGLRKWIEEQGMGKGQDKGKGKARAF